MSSLKRRENLKAQHNPFNEASEAYDAWYWENRPALEREWALVLEVAGEIVRPALEVGCGTGAIGAGLGFELGVDAARCALPLALQKGMLPVAADARRLPFPSNAFGTVGFFFVLEFIPEAEKALREAWRVLRQGGKLLVMGFSPERQIQRRGFYQGFVKHWAPEEISQVLKVKPSTVKWDRELLIYAASFLKP